ncbi:RNase H domain-containing protein [Sarocladium implicatum]|nr:RNase H domain-containing protein [Sarocladium implicatum]
MPTTTVNSKKRAMPGSAVSVAPTATASKKRKVDAGPKFYAVKAGFKPGVYTQYSDCQAQTAGFKGAIFKSFTSRQDAEAFVAGKKVASSTPSKDRFYAVAVGNQPGIYTDWADVAPTIVGVKGPKYKRFDTRAEAVNYIIEFGNKEAIEAIGEEGKLSKKQKTYPDPLQALLDDDAGESIEEEKKDDGIVRIYTDGSSLANGRAGSRAGVGVWFGDGDRRNIAERLVGEPQTNQRAELQAIYRALEVAPIDQPVQIYTDSQYSINCVTQWAMSWQRKGWKTAAGEEVKNQDIIRRVLQRMEERKKTGAATMFQWVKGHAMNRGNEAADALAVKESLPQVGSPIPDSSIRDILIVAVDVDTGGGYETISPNQSFHVGISILDTRYFTRDTSIDPETAITSYQFINHDTKPCRSAAKRFLLGATETHTPAGMSTRISTLAKDRAYVLVAHGINEDLKFLNNIDEGIAARACYILDTVKAAQYTLKLYYRYSLEKLLDALGIPCNPFRLHAAGNDAYYALKALLMIAARDMVVDAVGDQHTFSSRSSTATTLEAIASCPYPRPVDKPREVAGPDEKPPKLSLGAKRRLRQERKAIRQATSIPGRMAWL